MGPTQLLSVPNFCSKFKYLKITNPKTSWDYFGSIGKKVQLNNLFPCHKKSTLVVCNPSSGSKNLDSPEFTIPDATPPLSKRTTSGWRLVDRQNPNNQALRFFCTNCSKYSRLGSTKSPVHCNIEAFVLKLRYWLYKYLYF